MFNGECKKSHECTFTELNMNKCILSSLPLQWQQTLFISHFPFLFFPLMFFLCENARDNSVNILFAPNSLRYEFRPTMSDVSRDNSCFASKFLSKVQDQLLRVQRQNK